MISSMKCSGAREGKILKEMTMLLDSPHRSVHGSLQYRKEKRYLSAEDMQSSRIDMSTLDIVPFRTVNSSVRSPAVSYVKM